MHRRLAWICAALVCLAMAAPAVAASAPPCAAPSPVAAEVNSTPATPSIGDLDPLAGAEEMGINCLRAFFLCSAPCVTPECQAECNAQLNVCLCQTQGIC